MRKLLFAMLYLLLIGAPAGAMSIVDDENANDQLATAGVQISRGADPSAHVGSFSLTRNDVDFLGLGPLVAGDVITAVTTPLEDGSFMVPDTILAVFDAAGDRLTLNDDADGVGFGSAIGFVVPSDGDYFLAAAARETPLSRGFTTRKGVTSSPSASSPSPSPTRLRIAAPPLQNPKNSGPPTAKWPTSWSSE